MATPMESSHRLYRSTHSGLPENKLKKIRNSNLNGTEFIFLGRKVVVALSENEFPGDLTCFCVERRRKRRRASSQVSFSKNRWLSGGLGWVRVSPLLHLMVFFSIEGLFPV